MSSVDEGNFGFANDLFGSSAYSSFWGLGGQSINFSASNFVISQGYVTVNENMFYFRSPSSITGDAATSIGGTTATLNATFNRGAFTPTDNLFRGFVETTTLPFYAIPDPPSGGRLDWDSIASRGFIYTLNSDATISSDVRGFVFSDSLLINGVLYPFPTAAEISANNGVFVWDGVTFYITNEINPAPGQTVSYNRALTGLTPETNYYAWAYVKYSFQKSIAYPSVSDRITFTTTVDCDHLTAPVASANQSFCNDARISDLIADAPANAIVRWYADAVTTDSVLSTKPLANTTYFARSVTSDCVSGDATPVAVTLTATLGAPTATTPQTFCTGATVALLQAEGTGILWYDVATGGTALEGIIPLVNGATYYAAQSNAACGASERTAVTVTIDNSMTLPQPDITTPQSLCAPATLADIAIPTGSPNVVWYETATSTVPLSPTTDIPAAGGTYHAAYTAGGTCQSATRLAVTVNITTTQTVAPDVDTPQSFCPGATIANIAVPNSGIVWYAAATGGTALPDNAILSNNTTYFAAQSAQNCVSSARKGVEISIGAPEEPIAPTPQEFCGTATVASLAATGSGIAWFIDNTTTDQLLLGDVLTSGTYFVAQTTGNCIGTRKEITVTILSSGLTAPEAETPQTFCNGATVANLVAQGSNIKWYTTLIGGENLASTEDLVNGTTYYAAQSAGNCESTARTAVTVTLQNNVELGAPNILPAQQNLCLPATLADIAIPSAINANNIVWYDAAIDGALLQANTPITAAGTFYAALTAGGACESATRTAVTITVDQISPVAPTINPSSQTFCTGATIANIVVPNNQITWYNALIGGTLLPAGTILSSGTYYAAMSAGYCQSTSRTEVNIQIDDASLPAPTGPSTQTICGSGTLANLQVTGSNIKWFDAETDGNELQLTDVLEDGVTYYAAQQSTINCGSGSRLAVTVVLLPEGLSSPVANTPQTFCNGATVANLVAQGANIRWYTALTGGTELESTDALVDGTTYYAAQSAGNCESISRTAVTVILESNIELGAPNIPSQSLCLAATLADIAIPSAINANNVVWYDAAIEGTLLSLDTPIPAAGGTFYAALTAGGTCESATRTAVTIAVISTSPSAAPDVDTPQDFCAGATIANIVVPNNQIVWYATNTSTDRLPEGTILSEGSYFAAQLAGTCESVSRREVVITIGATSLPAPTGPTSQTICGEGTLADLQVTGSSIIWYSASTGGSVLSLNTPLENGITYHAAQSTGNCESADRLAVTVTVLTSGITAPVANTPQTFCTGATVALLQAQGANIKWYLNAVPTAGETELENVDVLAHEVTYYAAQSAGFCESTVRTAVTVIINNTVVLGQPNLDSPQDLCATARLSDIAIPAGSPNVVWYAAATGGDPLNPATVIPNPTNTYYAAYTAGGSCESTTRQLVTVNISTTLTIGAPAVNPQTFCTGATIANIVVPDNRIIWYDAAAPGGTLLPASTVLSSGTYYAAMTAGTCESATRTPVNIQIDDTSLPAPTGPTTQTICGGGTLAKLQVTGSNIVWYNNANEALPLHTALEIGTTTYHAVQSTGNCASGDRLTVTVTVTEGLSAPGATTPQTFCSGATVALLQATGSGIIWYNESNEVVPPTAELVSGIYSAAQTNATCGESTDRTFVNVIIVTTQVVAAPDIPGTQSLCAPATLANIAIPTGTGNGSDIKWFNVATGGGELPLNTPLENGTTYYAAKTAGGTCVSANRTPVLISISGATPAVPVITSPQTLCEVATIANIAVPNNQIKWYDAAVGGNVLAPGFQLANGATYYAAMTAGGCESATYPVDIVIGAPGAPSGATSQSFCGSVTLANLSVTGSGILWFADQALSIPLSDPANTPLENGATYYAVQSSGENCKGADYLAITVGVIESNLNPPSAVTPQTLCTGATISNLVAAGLNIKWYDALTGGNLLASNFPLVDGETYFAVQSAGGCESAIRTAVTVAIQEMVLPAPNILPNPQNLCGTVAVPVTVASIIIPTGINNVVWYDSNDNELSSTDLLTTGTYYAATRVGSCESATRTAVVINVVSSFQVPAPAPIISPQSFCPGATVADIVLPNNQVVVFAPGGTTPLAPETALTTGTYTVNVRQMYGTCGSAGRPPITINVGAPAAPVAPPSQTFCFSGTVADLSATGAGLLWYASNTATEPLALNEPLVTGEYFVGSSACPSPRTRVEVSVLIDGLTPPSAITPQVFCGDVFVSDLQATGTGIRWYQQAEGGTALANTVALTSGLYYAAQSTGNCESVTRTAVNVIIDNALELNPPAITTPQRLCTEARLSDVAIPTGINPNNVVWYSAATGGSQVASNTLLTTGTHTYFAALVAGSCESAERRAVTITVGTTLPAVPQITTPQSFCLGAMISNIVVPNNQIRWYRTATGPVADSLASGTVLASGTYFASQGAGGCESSPRTQIQIVVGNTMDEPNVPESFSVCGSGTLADLNVNGIGILWYATADETDNTPLPLTTALSVGTTTYYVVQSSGDCESARKAVAVTLHNAMAPVASTPQSFCESEGVTVSPTLTLADLIVTGNNIKWYSTPTGGTELPLSTSLTDGATYYASQSSDLCGEGASRTAVTVKFESRIILDAPVIEANQTFCGSATLADIATDGSSIKWYASLTSTDELSLTTSLENGQSYFAAQVLGTCQSANRTEVSVTIMSGATIAAPAMITPQHFCEGAALIANLAVPNNQILWYEALTGGTPLSSGTELQEGFYYAAQGGNNCENALRATVEVIFGNLSAPIAQGGFCNNVSGLTLLNIPITGSGIVWYKNNVQVPATTPLANGDVYYAAQTSGSCESARTRVEIFNICHQIRGTMFPFVQEGWDRQGGPSVRQQAFNRLFPVIIKLTAVPPPCLPPLGMVHRLPALDSDSAIYYTGQTFVPSTPKNPGVIGNLNNPGEPIRWADKMHMIPPGPADPLKVEEGEVPSAPVGLFTFEDVAPGWYLLHITRRGFLSRFVRIYVDPIEGFQSRHWELLAGDVNGNLRIDGLDLSAVRGNISEWDFNNPNNGYIPWHDLNADGVVNVSQDMRLVQSNIGVDTEIYADTYDWFRWALTPAPSGAGTQSVCGTLANLTVTTNIPNAEILWFADRALTNPLPANTPLVHNTTYFAVQTNSEHTSCSPLAVRVNCP
jgi:hypothetical protein